ncbi:MAG: signal peptidase [Clostridiales bacterium]|jgi:signal peptidase I|nr:signal peptidase [Clostridiales bacterium]
MNGLKKEMAEWIQAILITLVVFLIYNFFFGTTTVYNTSMYPTLVEKDMLFMVKRGSIERGDIVSFQSSLTLTQADYDGLNFLQKLLHKPGEPKNLIKRVIAGPGDSIEISDGKVYVNGEELNETYIHSTTSHDVAYQVIPEGEYFMMGDNRTVSYDSRELGLIDESDIIGKVVFRFMPLQKIGTVN